MDLTYPTPRTRIKKKGMDLSGSGDVSICSGRMAMRTPHVFAAVMDLRWGAASDLIWCLPQSHCSPLSRPHLPPDSSICVLNHDVFMGGQPVARREGSKAGPTMSVCWQNISIRKVTQRRGIERAHAHPEFMTHLLIFFFCLFPR